MDIGEDIGELIYKGLSNGLEDIHNRYYIDYDNKFMLFNVGIDRGIGETKRVVVNILYNGFG